LLELPRGLTATQLAGGFGLLNVDTLPGRIEQSFLSRIKNLSEQTRMLLLIAAAEPTGDPALLWRAAERMGIDAETALQNGTGGLLVFDGRVIFRHPLVRSAVYRSAADEDRRAVHRALAEVSEVQTDPDRRAWHLASATAGPDESVAAELERSAGRAQLRGGLAAAAAFLERSVTLTVDTSRRADRALAAADAALGAGDLDTAQKLLDIAERDAQSELQRVRAHLGRSHVTFAAGYNNEAPPMLLEAAQRLEPFDMDLSRGTYLVAWASAAFGAGHRDSLMAISQAMKGLPVPDGRDPRALDLVLEGYARLMTGSRSDALPTLRKAMSTLIDAPPPDLLKWGWAANGLFALLWEDRLLAEWPAKVVEEVRRAGMLSELPVYLHALGMPLVSGGDFAAAATIVAEYEAVAAATGVPMASHTKLLLAAMRGRESEAAPLIAATIEEAAVSGQLTGAETAHWVAAILHNGLARYEQALTAAQNAQNANVITIQWALPELVEAAARVGDDTAAHGALDDLTDAAEPCDTDWAQGILARSRALLSDDAAADGLYREAIERLGRTRLRPDLARAHLLYGEWLRRDRQRAKARTHLRTAYEMFTSIGMEAFAERARRELLATGETVSKRKNPASASEELTPQEQQIALLVRDGLTNPEVGARLFVSPRTVEWHLRKIFTKLGISSRRQLPGVLPGGE
jgi:DNA-binding CsgD family transcriptional regulator